jgi:predicted CXXCH cytochrome family protein
MFLANFFRIDSTSRRRDMKKILTMSAVFLLVCAGNLAFSQTVVGTAHDLSATGPGAQSNVARVCVFCHTPHQAVAANGQEPLWNHTLSATAAYGVYDSDTMNAVPTDVGGATAGTADVTNLCLSCHDGTVAVHTLYNVPNEADPVTITAGGNVDVDGKITGDPLVGTSLTNDHPVNFIYDGALATADGGLNTPDSADWVDAAQTVPLFDTTVQCASCHDPHDNSFAPFMVIDNTGSALCTTCHIK